jgi:hypothetical protein
MESLSSPTSILAWCSLSILCACGGGSTGTSGAGGSTSSASASTGTTASSSSSTSATGGTGGGGTCAPGGNAVGMQGTIAGQAVAHSYKLGASTSDAVSLRLSFGDGGILYFPNFGGSQGFVLMPGDGPLPGALLFVNSLAFSDGTFTLDNLYEVGNCPATSGQGNISFCYDSGNACPGGNVTTTSGTVKGAAFDWGGATNFKNAATSVSDLLVEWQSGAALVAAHDGDDTAGKLTAGFLLMPSPGADPGAVWCVGAGQFTSSPNTTQIDVGTLTRLGPVLPAQKVAGSITGCY